jgi:hypothetical protein
VYMPPKWLTLHEEGDTTPNGCHPAAYKDVYGLAATVLRGLFDFQTQEVDFFGGKIRLTPEISGRIRVPSDEFRRLVGGTSKGPWSDDYSLEVDTTTSPPTVAWKK